MTLEERIERLEDAVIGIVEAIEQDEVIPTQVILTQLGKDKPCH